MSFVLNNYKFVDDENKAYFTYENSGILFTETVQFTQVKDSYNKDALDRAMFLAFVLIGTSYYKTFPSRTVEFEQNQIDTFQAKFFNLVYQEGMSQFAFENNLKRSDLAVFGSNSQSVVSPIIYSALDNDPLLLQSGGKDSLLVATLIEQNGVDFTPWYMTYSNSHPVVLDSFKYPLVDVNRFIDKDNINKAIESGGINGHVPITYIVFAISLIQAILLCKDTVLVAIGHEGEEPYAMIDDLPVAHQWAKTWGAEVAFADYVKRYISADLKIGSPIRKYSELKVAELFVEKSWSKYSNKFSSCNLGNYKQGNDNTYLGWCGNCPKCANSFLLFAPFVEPGELSSVFNGENLFKKDSLTETFKGLLGIDGVEKPFECVGEEAELRKAYNLAHDRSNEYTLPFAVPDSDFDYNKEYPSQPWASKFI